jgi:hypothetical protein
MKTRTIAVLGGLGVAAIALIGAGASATFSTSTTSSQSITAGTLSVVLYGPSGSSGDGSNALTLPSVGPVGSTFASTPVEVQIYNNGNITASEITLQVTDTNNNSTLQGEVWACMVSGWASSSPWIMFNQPLWQIESYGSLPLAGQGIPVSATGTDIAPGASDYYTLQFYAGPTAATQCGSTVKWTDPAPAYPNPTGGGPPGANTAAASLTTPAEGGTVIPALTLTYQG